VVVTVEDNGPGVPGGKLKHIQNPFYTTKMEGEGTGLGLTVVENIIALHGAKRIIKNRHEGSLIVSMLINSIWGSYNEKT